MSVREYIGARYIPLFADPIEWDSTTAYEPLTVVKNQGNSYISRQFVPEGIALTDENYWILWADFNAQLEQYRQEVQRFDGRITANANAIAAETTARGDADTALETSLDTLSDSLDLLKNSAHCFSTVADMVSAQYLVNGDFAKTSSYRAGGAGGAFYKIATQPSYGYDAIELSNGLFADMVPAPALTPEMFGAYGNGTDDDTAFIRKAVANGGVIRFEPSTYLVSDVIRLTAGTRIDLNGATINCTARHLFYNFETSDDFTAYNGNGNLVFENGTIIGGGISLIHAENCKFDNLSFKNVLNDHIIELAACKNVTVENCSFVGMLDQTGNLEYINLDSCTFTAFPWLEEDSVTYDGTVNDNIRVVNNYFNKGVGNYAAMLDAIGVHYVPDSTRLHKNVIIADNVIEGYPFYGISILGCTGAIVTGNMITASNWCIRAGYGDNNAVIGNRGICSGYHSFCVLDAAVNMFAIDENVFTAAGGDNAGEEYITGGSNLLNSTFSALQKTFVGSNLSSFPIALTAVNKIYIHRGSVGAGTYYEEEISPYFNRMFQVGESFPFIYVNDSKQPAVGTLTIGSNVAVTSDVQIRDLYVACDRRKA